MRGELLTFAHGGRIRIGDWCYIGELSRVWSACDIAIGDRVLISHGVNIHDTDSHPRDAVARHRQYIELSIRGHPTTLEGVASAPIRIDDDVWIGFNAVVLKGVSIGARSIVAAASVVTRDVPADCVVIGSEIRPRT